MCIEGNRKKTLWQKKEIGKRHSERERERFESCPQPTPVSLHFQAKGNTTSLQHIKPFDYTSCLKLYCVVFSYCSAFVGLSYVVQNNKMPFLILSCFVLFSF